VPFTRWDALHDLLALHEQIGQLVGADAPGWTPPVDLYETSHEFVLTAELAGLSRSDIDIHAEDFRIVIRGARGAASSHAASSEHAPGTASTQTAPQRTPGELPSEQYHRVERGHGRFSRAFSLPEIIDVDGITADLKDGILTVTLPKSRDRGTRRIDVS